MDKTLLREGTVFNAYLISEAGIPKYIAKELILNTQKGKRKYINELQILKNLLGKKGYAQLAKESETDFFIEYISHLNYDAQQWFDLLAKNRNRRDELARLIVNYNQTEIKAQITDQFLINTIKSFGKGLLKKKLDKQFVWCCVKSILSEVSVPKNEKTLLHNDFTTNNILCNESGEIYIIDFDRGTTATKFVFRDILYFILRSQEILEWTWQYELFCQYYMLRNINESKENFYRDLYYTCIRLCLFYVHEKNIQESNLYKNMKYLINKQNAQAMLERMWEKTRDN